MKSEKKSLIKSPLNDTALLNTVSELSKKAVECYDFAQEHQKELEEVDLTWYDLWLDQQDILDV